MRHCFVETAHVCRTAGALLAAGMGALCLSVVLSAAGCGGSVTSPPLETPAPTPTPAPGILVRSVEGLILSAPNAALLWFTTTERGAIHVTEWWRDPKDGVVIFGVAAGERPCDIHLEKTGEPWATVVKTGTTEPCEYLPTTSVTSDLPSTLTTIPVDPGTYTLMVGNSGPDLELVTLNIYTVP